MERFAYLLKHRSPGVFRGVEVIGRAVTNVRFARRRERALLNARIEGTVGGRPSEIRSLEVGDVPRLNEFLAAMPEEHLRFIHPHGLSAREVERVVGSRAFMTYGLVVSGELVAYALLKLAPTGSAFMGLLVAPKFHGRGLGRFLVHYLYWQASLAGFRARSTISQHNVASVRAHRAVGEYRVVAALPNDYSMIEFPRHHMEPPTLQI